MSNALTVRKLGNSLGLLLTRPVVEALGVREGDELFVTRTPDGIRLTPYDPDFADVIESNRSYMKRHKNALRELAKG